MSTASDLPGFEVPLHRSLTEPILLGGAPRTVAIANGTLAAAVGRHHEEAEVIVFSAKFEAELAELAEPERLEFLESAGVHETGLERLIQSCHRLLGLETFFTIGESEIRAWTISAGTTAYEAAGKIHTDFQRGFIRAETVHFDEFVRAGSYKAARDQGIVRSEGRDYVVRDGDILLIRFKV
jgi:ribosome-binding ATPase YchF (GTP1/OBG family)